MSDSLSDNARRRQQGFTLIELLVVIGVITVLLAILIPAVGKMRQHAYTAATQATMNRIAQSINNYFNDHQAYPGVLPNRQFTTSKGATPTLTGLTSPANYTQTEDCAMALLGGWQSTSATALT